MDTQAQLDDVEELRMEWGLDLAWGRGGKEGSSVWSHRKSPWLDGGGLELGFVVVLSAERPSTGE